MFVENLVLMIHECEFKYMNPQFYILVNLCNDETLACSWIMNVRVLITSSRQAARIVLHL